MYWVNSVFRVYRSDWLANRFFFPRFAVGFVLLSIVLLHHDLHSEERQVRCGLETLSVLCIGEIQVSGYRG